MYERAIAIKIPIKTLQEGEYYQSTGDYNPHHIEVNGNQISRVNIIAKIKKKKDDTYLEDETGKIKVVSFDIELDVEEGDTVRVIGKIRERNEERFVAVETIVKVDEKELKLRKLELEKNPLPQPKPLKKEENKTEEDLEVEIEELEI